MLLAFGELSASQHRALLQSSIIESGNHSTLCCRDLCSFIILNYQVSVTDFFASLVRALLSLFGCVLCAIGSSEVITAGNFGGNFFIFFNRSRRWSLLLKIFHYTTHTFPAAVVASLSTMWTLFPRIEAVDSRRALKSEDLIKNTTIWLFACHSTTSSGDENGKRNSRK